MHAVVKVGTVSRPEKLSDSQKYIYKNAARIRSKGPNDANISHN